MPLLGRASVAFARNDDVETWRKNGKIVLMATAHSDPYLS